MIDILCELKGNRATVFENSLKNSDVNILFCDDAKTIIETSLSELDGGVVVVENTDDYVAATDYFDEMFSKYATFDRVFACSRLHQMIVKYPNLTESYKWLGYDSPASSYNDFFYIINPMKYNERVSNGKSLEHKELQKDKMLYILDDKTYLRTDNNLHKILEANHLLDWNVMSRTAGVMSIQVNSDQELYFDDCFCKPYDMLVSLGCDDETVNQRSAYIDIHTKEFVKFKLNYRGK